MTEDEFILKNEERWKQLETYNVILAKKSVRALEIDQIDEFAELFRAVSLHLAYAKTHFPNGGSVSYLNQLAGMAHQHFYLRQKSGLASVTWYIRKGFGRALHAKRAYVVFSFGLFMAGALISMAMILFDREYASLFLPDEYIQAAARNNPVSMAGDANFSFLSAYIMTNNINVSLLAFAGGVTVGLGTVYILFLNGAVLGGLSCLFAVNGSDMLHFFSLILPHGFIELTAIFISGACGLIIGQAVLTPNDLKRKDSFIKGAKEAAYFVPGIALMLVIAGLIEGFFTPLPILPWIKLVFSFATPPLMVLGYRLALK
ncbi:MAG: stage II sporulation protein M [Clostridiales bacterium]|nr:stage II sporulation protein M [Clostridiales bacterium]